MSVNKVILIGNVGKDPEMRYPQNGTQMAFFSLATNERRGDAEITEWHRIVAYGQIAGIVERFVRKGTKLYIEGALHTGEYVDRYNVSRKITEIVVSNLELLGRSEAQ